jgi:hypothetical protein
MPHQDRLLTDKQMQSIRGLALLGMVTRITIERQGETTPPVDGDYGDDFLSYTQTTESRFTEVKGWFYSTPTRELEVDTGAVVTANTYRLFLPVGTDVLPGDRVHVGNEDYTVTDTTAEGTWLPLLTCNLRKRE